MDWNIEVFNRSRERVAVLEKAHNICYTKEKDKLSKAEFALMVGDIKNKYCKPFNFIKLYENGEYIDMFRIMPSELTKDATTNSVTYYCEHVLGTLLDTCLFQYHEIGGVGVFTQTILNYILGKQTNWKLGKCGFARQFQYSWENENLLSALFSVPNPFGEDYSFTWDTTVYPWVINLVKPSNEIKAYFRYKRNMKGVKKREDGSVVCTRLYALGYGEGVNQLGISNYNPTGKPYIEADTVGIFGVIEKIWVDLRYQLEKNLYCAAKAKLEKIKQPKVVYEIEAAELWALTKIPVDKFDEGDVVRVIDEEAGIDTITRVVKKSKSNIENDYISASIQVSSDGGNSSDGLSELFERAKINEANAQGATNINNYSYYGNCDTKYPAKARFKIPEEAVNLNKVELSFQADAFRAFSKAIKGGGSVQTSTSSGGGTSSTTNSGGSTSSTTDSGGATSSTTNSGGATSSTTDSGGRSYTTSGIGLWFDFGRGNSGDYVTSVEGSGTEWNHAHVIDTNHDHTIEIQNHNHYFSTPNHSHSFTIPNHRHDFSIPSHSHGFTVSPHSHDITLKDHEHQIEYGIYEGPTASKFKVTVDGAATALTAAGDSFDIVAYLKKDSGGKIVRGWHEVLISPDNLCMINADVMVQVFVNSRGGGNY